MNEMENQRIAEELQRQHLAQHHSQRTCSQCAPLNRHSKDSGVVDVDMIRAGIESNNRLSAPECVAGASGKKNALSNSLIDLAQGQSVIFIQFSVCLKIFKSPLKIVSVIVCVS